VTLTEPYYEAYWSDEGFKPTDKGSAPLRRLLAETIGPDDSCIDIGCGDGGTSAVWLSANAGQYVGVDVSSGAVELARSRGFEAVHIRDASELPFESGSFDAATCIEVLEHLFDPVAALREMRRVLRPGGVALVTVPNVAHWRQRLDMVAGRWNPGGDDQSVERPWRDPHLRFFTPASLGRLLREAGFQNVETGSHGPPAARDIPVLRGLSHADDPGPFYRGLTRMAPSLFGKRCHAIAVSPGPDAGA
jgi:SAM-dependent methyltransferase